MFPFLTRPRISAAKFADLTVTSCDDFEDLEEQESKALQRAFVDMEAEFYEPRQEQAEAGPSPSRDPGARKRGGVGPNRVNGALAQAREDAGLGSRTYQRVPSDRQTYRPLNVQCSEWHPVQPHLRVRGATAPAQQQHKQQHKQQQQRRASMEGVQEVPTVTRHRRSLTNGWATPERSPAKARREPASDWGSSPAAPASGSPGNRQSDPGPADQEPSPVPGPGSGSAAATPLRPDLDLCVDGRAVVARRADKAAAALMQAQGLVEEVLAIDGTMSEVFALQYDELEAHVPRPAPAPARSALSMAPPAASRRPSHFGDPDNAFDSMSVVSKPRASEAAGGAPQQQHGLDRDSKAQRLGLPCVEPGNSMHQQATDMAFDVLWQQLVPVLLPLVQQRLAARLAERQEAARQEEARRLRAERRAEERAERKQSKALEVEFEVAEAEEAPLELKAPEERSYRLSSGYPEAAEKVHPLLSHSSSFPYGDGKPVAKGRGSGRPPVGRSPFMAPGRGGLGQGFLAPIGYVQTDAPFRGPGGPSGAAASGPQSSGPPAAPQLLTAAYGAGRERDAPAPPAPPQAATTGRFWHSAAGGGALWGTRKRSSSLQPLLPPQAPAAAPPPAPPPPPPVAHLFSPPQRAWHPTGPPPNPFIQPTAHVPHQFHPFTSHSGPMFATQTRAQFFGPPPPPPPLPPQPSKPPSLSSSSLQFPPPPPPPPAPARVSPGPVNGSGQPQAFFASGLSTSAGARPGVPSLTLSPAAAAFAATGGIAPSQADGWAANTGVTGVGAGQAGARQPGDGTQWGASEAQQQWQQRPQQQHLQQQAQQLAQLHQAAAQHRHALQGPQQQQHPINGQQQQQQQQQQGWGLFHGPQSLGLGAHAQAAAPHQSLPQHQGLPPGLPHPHGLLQHSNGTEERQHDVSPPGARQQQKLGAKQPSSSAHASPPDMRLPRLPSQVGR